jgi:NAD(P)-dependent dehydrogenase (short-subunit alcohol dehydrogenase family)
VTQSDARVAIVTGGVGGLGSAMVKRFLDDGLRVAVADLNVSLDAVDRERMIAVPVDVTQPPSAQAMARTVIEAFGRIDVLVNNAGIAGPSAPVTEYPEDAWHRVLEVNLFGVFHCTKACLPASKAGVIAFTKSVAKENLHTGVLVNCVVPGVIDAGLTSKTTEDERQLFLSRVPLGRMGRPEELAELVSWLASPRCSFSTGATYDLTGGRAVY